MTRTTTPNGALKATRKAPEVKIVLTHDQIAKLAYEVWLRKDKPQGQDEQNWRAAEEILLSLRR